MINQPRTNLIIEHLTNAHNQRRKSATIQHLTYARESIKIVHPNDAMSELNKLLDHLNQNNTRLNRSIKFEIYKIIQLYL